jgi:DNA-binding CsgD family transcriptional regulator
MAMVGSVDFLMGQGVPEDVMEQAMGMESWERSRPTPVHPSVAFGLLLKWSDDLSRARSRLQDAYTRAKEEGNERSLPFLLFHLSELECWAGDIELAGRYAEEGCAVATQTGQEASLSFALYARALVDAYRGNVDAARDSAEQGLSLAERSGAAPARVLLASVLGFIELSLGDYSAAHRYLGPLAEAAAEAGVREPGVLRYIGDAIEDLIGLGDLDHARVLLDPLEERAQALRRLWALGVAARCRGLLSSAIGDQEGATQELERALSHHERLGQPFELGRTLLTLGMVQRRALQRRAARKSLEEALEIFHRLGASLWIDRVRAELARIGGRAPSSVELTPTEEQVARLVAEGRTNREVAEAMFLTVRTVEWNVSRIYRKLGVRSRTELSRWVQDRDRPDSSSS